MKNQNVKFNEMVVGKWGELFLGLLLCTFGLLIEVWAVVSTVTVGGVFFKWVAPGIIGFVSNFNNGVLILIFSIILVFSFELFYLNIKRKWIFILYYAIIAPLFISIITIWCSGFFLTISSS